MQTKLTLRLEQKLIQRAKTYSANSGKSISQMVADYFSSLGKRATNDPIKSTPIARSLRGSLHGNKVTKKDYHQYLENKYL